MRLKYWHSPNTIVCDMRYVRLFLALCVHAFVNRQSWLNTGESTTKLCWCWCDPTWNDIKRIGTPRVTDLRQFEQSLQKFGDSIKAGKKNHIENSPTTRRADDVREKKLRSHIGRINYSDARPLCANHKREHIITNTDWNLYNVCVCVIELEHHLGAGTNGVMYSARRLNWNIFPCTQIRPRVATAKVATQIERQMPSPGQCTGDGTSKSRQITVHMSITVSMIVITPFFLFLSRTIRFALNISVPVLCIPCLVKCTHKYADTNYDRCILLQQNAVDLIHSPDCVALSMHSSLHINFHWSLAQRYVIGCWVDFFWTSFLPARSASIQFCHFKHLPFSCDFRYFVVRHTFAMLSGVSVSYFSYHSFALIQFIKYVFDSQHWYVQYFDSQTRHASDTGALADNRVHGISATEKSTVKLYGFAETRENFFLFRSASRAIDIAN